MNTGLRCLRPALAAGLFGLATLAAAQTATPLADFSSAPGDGLYSYASSTPATLLDLVRRDRPRPAVTVQARLVLPPGASASSKVPAVVLVHGSGGVYRELVTFWARRLNEQGIAAFAIDVFGPRGVSSTADDQSQVPYAADTADAFAALGMLASHPAIDARRIAVMGFSRGGVAAVRSDVNAIVAGSAPPGLRFAAHIAAYSGGCAGTLAVAPKPGIFGPAPILFLHGDADDYTYASDCRSYAERIAAAGTPTEFVLLPGARHKFDVDDPRRIQLRTVAKSKEGCPLEFDVGAMTVRDRRNGEAVPQAGVAALSRELCADKGATMEGDSKARDASALAVLAFLNKTFGR